jgi:predicted NUDIX family NTP pyrophosphohydrolase
MVFPEIDRAEVFDMPAARQTVKAAQMPLVKEHEEILNAKTSGKH